MAERGLVLDQILEIDKCHFKSADVYRYPCFETRIKIHAFTACGYIDSNWRVAKLDELVRSKK